MPLAQGGQTGSESEREQRTVFSKLSGRLGSFKRSMSFGSPRRIKPGPGQESVWDYPRPPRFEKSLSHVRVVLHGKTLADTNRAVRVLETSHPPVFYIPPEDVQLQMLTTSARSTYCEWKCSAKYYDAPGVQGIGWYYPTPTPMAQQIKNFVAFYPSKVDQATVDDEEVRAQPGDFYGGWITSKVVGPFKGDSGTQFW